MSSAVETAKSVATTVALLGCTVVCGFATVFLNKSTKLVDNLDSTARAGYRTVRNWERISASLSSFCRHLENNEENGEKGLTQVTIELIQKINELLASPNQDVSAKLSELLNVCSEKISGNFDRIIGAFEKNGFTITVNNGPVRVDTDKNQISVPPTKK